jgi:adenine-specific DNA-methyltransferase
MYNNIEEIINYSQSFNQKDKNLIKSDGVVFTTKVVCDEIIRLLSPNINDVICEPSVGRGVFIFSLLEYFKINNNSTIDIIDFVENRLYCYDINSKFINDLKEMIISYFKFLGYDGLLNLNNIKCDDFLKQDIRYDIVIGNPPYVRIQNLDKKYLDDLKGNLKSMTLGNVDLYYAFLEKSIKCANKTGFIIPNSFIKTKSGKFLRELIIDNVNYIYDFENDKVWSGISTYTCIVICESSYSDTIIYETKLDKINKFKSDLNDNKWLFKDMEIGINKLSDLINYQQGGIATIKDNIFKIDSIDDFYCYKNNEKIEKGICKKVIKATKIKKFTNHSWIIYPYDDNGQVLSEEFISINYPFAYSYLIDNKDSLNTRDKGKTSNYDAWYSYGRRQGLLKKKVGRRIILPIVFKIK